MDERDDMPGAGRASSGGDYGAAQPSTDQVRIAAVEAAVVAGLSHAPPSDVAPEAGGPGGEGAGTPSADARVPEDADVEAGARGTAAETVEVRIPELPDWVDPPTGQVPRVLLDETADGDGASGSGATRGPTWREHPTDWDDDLGLGLFEELAEDVSGVAGRATPDVLEGPIDFAELDAELRRAVGPMLDPDVAEVEPDALDYANEAAWTAFAAGDEGAGAPVRERRTTDRPKANVAHRSARRRQATVPTAARSPYVATATGLVFGAVAVVCFLGGAPPALGLVAVVATFAAGEAFGTLRRSGRRPASVVGMASVAALVVGAYLRGPMAIPVVLACCAVVAAIWYLAEASVDGVGGDAPAGSPVTGLGATLLVVTWVGVLASFAGLLLSPAYFPHRHGVAFLLAAVVLTVAHDVGSYAVGATVGRHRVMASVSPNKTWEGLAGGTVLTLVVAGVALAHLHPLSVGAAIGLAALVSVLGPLGDLTESLVKRDLGVKDMGRVLPAHGGLLDRVDAILFVLPAAFFLFRVAHLS